MFNKPTFEQTIQDVKELFGDLPLLPRNQYPSLNTDISGNGKRPFVIDMTINLDTDIEKRIRDIVKNEIQKSGLYELAAQVRGHDRYIEDLRESLRNKY